MKYLILALMITPAYADYETVKQPKKVIIEHKHDNRTRNVLRDVAFFGLGFLVYD